MEGHSMMEPSTLSADASSKLMIVDDDEPFRLRLARAMERRGFLVETAGSIA